MKRFHPRKHATVPLRLPPLFRADPICRLWFLRGVEAAGLDCFGTVADAMDDDLLAAIGFERTPEGLGLPALRGVLRAAIARFSAARPRGVLHANVARLARTAGLDAVESQILTVMVRMCDGAFRTFQRHDIVERWEDLEQVCAGMLDLPRAQVARALHPRSTLRRAGLVSDRRLSVSHLHIGPARHVLDVVIRRYRSDDEFVRTLVPPASRGHLGVEDYPSLADHIGLVRALLRQAMTSTRKRPRPLNVLLHGPPGTGKTELARAIAAAEGASLYEVAVTDDDGDPATRLERLSHLALCQWMLLGRRDAVLLVDEAEDIFPAAGLGPHGFFGLLKGASPENKGYITQLLDTVAVPTVWITNSVGAMDEAFLRRFDLIMAVDSPRGIARRRLVERSARKVRVEPELLDRLTQDVRLAPAMITRAMEVARVAQAAADRRHRAGVADTSDDERAVSAGRAVELVTEGFLRARGEEPRPSRRAPVLGWDPALIHATPSVDSVLDAFTTRRVSQASLLLLGPPGAGKTELARQLAAQSGRPLIEKKASELLSKWVGDTEKQLAQMFREARAAGAVLFLDEAESFLSSRSAADADWRVSQTNELLTRMADFDGIFLCATNLVDRFDEAAFRRFDLKVTFHPLTEVQRRKLLGSAFSDVLDGEGAAALAALAAGLGGLCTGDVVAVKRGLRLSADAPRPHDVAALLAAEVARREKRRSRHIGFA